MACIWGLYDVSRIVLWKNVLFFYILPKHPLTEISARLGERRPGMGRGVSWSPEDVAALQCYFEAGKSPAYVAAHRPDWPLSSIKKAMANIRKGQVMGGYKGRKTKFDTPRARETRVTPGN